MPALAEARVMRPSNPRLQVVGPATVPETPLVFDRDFDEESERDCLKRTNDIIKNARSTNPMHQDPPPRGKGSHHKRHHSKSPKSSKKRATRGP